MLPKGFLVGNVSADPQSGVAANSSNAYVRLSVVCENKFAKSGESPKGHFFNLVAWGKNVKFIQEYVRKGDKVFIEFQLSTSSYVSQEGKNVKSIDFLIIFIEKLGVSSQRREAYEPENHEEEESEEFSDSISLSELGL